MVRRGFLDGGRDLRHLQPAGRRRGRLDGDAERDYRRRRQLQRAAGSTTATGLPGDLFSQQEQRWLGVQVQGEPEQPRVLMVSVPYAFKAHEAETLGGRSVSDFVLANGANFFNQRRHHRPVHARLRATVPAAAEALATIRPPAMARPTSAARPPTRLSGSRRAEPGLGLVASAADLGYQGHGDRPQRHGLRCPRRGDRYGRRWTHRHSDFYDRIHLRLARNFQQHVGNRRARH